jgi:hypothetical protein
VRVNAIGPFAPLGRRKPLRVSISVAVLIEIESRRVNQTRGAAAGSKGWNV